MVIFIVIVGILIMLDIAPKVYLHFRNTDVNNLNSLRTDLDLSTIVYTPLINVNPLTIVSRYQVLINLNSEIGKIKDYQNQKDEIIKNFENSINKYASDISKYSQLDLSFMPKDLSLIDFKTKKDNMTYLSDLKQKFRQSIINYNSITGNDVLRWELNIEQEVKNMSLDEKVGAMFSFSFEGTNLSSEEAAFIKNNHVGGIAYFGSNISDQSQVANLSRSIQNLDPKYPLLISTDEEGATVQRLPWDDPRGGRQIGDLSQADQCTFWKDRSYVLQQAGINWNLGIIADVTSDPNSFIYYRVLSSDYNNSAADVKTAVDCSDTVLSTLKHWPGHGSTEVNTHLVVGISNTTSEVQWKSRDYIPFASGIAENADTVMQGHLVLNWLDPNIPASLSSKSVDYLRNTLRFKGLIVTDAMNMLETAGYNLADAVKQALLAGNDILFLVDDNNDLNTQLLNMTKDMINSGDLKIEDVNPRIKIILEKKNKIITSIGNFIPSNLVY